MDSNEWESHRPTIVRLYLEEGYKLHQVAAYMKEMHDFDKNQFEYKLAKWGVRKNARRDEWQYLRRQMQKREGRISEVTIRGRIIPEHKVRRELQRYTTIPTAREFQARLPSPKTPEGDIIRVMSPSIGDLQHSWPNNLPWFQFKEQVPFKTVSATIVNLVKSIPGIGGGEGVKTQQLCNIGDMNSMATHLLVVLLFRLSNKLHKGGLQNEGDTLHDSLVMQSRSHTSGAIKEAVYASAVRTSKYEIISQLLKAGVDPDLAVPIYTRQVFKIRREKASMEWETPTRFPGSGLEIAAYRLDTRLAVMLLEAGATVGRSTILLYLVAAGNNHDRTVEIAQLLVGAGFKVDRLYTRSSILPKRALKEIFLTACLAGDLGTAEKLLGLGIELDEGWELGITPLVATAWNPDTKLAESLLRLGVRVDPLNQRLASSSRSPSALHVAAFNGNTALVQLLLDCGANLNLRFTPLRKDKDLYDWLIPSDHTSPFQFALESGDPDTAALLYPQAELLGGELAQAVAMENEKLVSDLLSRAPDILSSEQEGGKVLEAAATSGNIRVVTWFFSSGGYYQSRALFKAVQAAIMSKDISIVELLSAHRSLGPIDDYEASVDLTERQKLLNSAIANGLVQRVREWIPLVGSLDFSVVFRTPLQKAAEQDDIVLVRLLIDAGAEVNAPAYHEYGVTALQAAAARGNLGIATLLIQNKADVNAPAARLEGRTALEAAAEHGRLDMVHFLLESGAILEGPMRIHYVRSVGFAIRGGHFAVATYLEEHGAWTDKDRELYDMAGILNIDVHFVYNEETQDWKTRRINYNKEKDDSYSVAYSDTDTGDDPYSESSDDTAEYANPSSRTEGAILSAVGFTDNDSDCECSDDTEEYADSSSQTEGASLSANGLMDEAMEGDFDLEAFLEEPLEGHQGAMPRSTMSWIMGVDASAEEWNTEEHGARWGTLLIGGGDGFPETFDENYFDLEAFRGDSLDEDQVAMPPSTMSWIMEVDASAEEPDREEHSAQWGPMLTEGEGFPGTVDENDFWNIQ
ncbi:hypothetical protein DL770_007386 [Monosporascus sp. CRB-9-2]|nr:hypothetical protein DL770_007386 [Monosporascus sp. CRB-9-2]